MGPFVQTQQRAWQEFDAFSRDPRVIFVGEPVNLEQAFRNLSDSQSPSHSHWTDSYLAAFASTSGWSLVSFDKGFARFQQVQIELLA